MLVTKHSHTCKGGVQRIKKQTTKHSHICKGGVQRIKKQTTKHSHTCKRGVQRKKHKLQNTVTHACKREVQRKKHKLQNTVTHARGEYSAKSSCCTRIKNTKQGLQCSCCELLNLALKLRPDLTQRFPHKMYNLSNFQEVITSLKSNQYQN